MKKHVKQKWIRALRDPGYKQTKGVLVDQYDRFDALGVLCNISPRSLGGWIKRKSVWTFNGYYGMPPTTILEWAGLTYQQARVIVTMNDQDAPFLQIADYIDRNF